MFNLEMWLMRPQRGQTDAAWLLRKGKSSLAPRLPAPTRIADTIFIHSLNPVPSLAGTNIEKIVDSLSSLWLNTV